eukprot:629728-Pleurochrysis_carterae.AAC.1
MHEPSRDSCGRRVSSGLVARARLVQGRRGGRQAGTAPRCAHAHADESPSAAASRLPTSFTSPPPTSPSPPSPFTPP